MSAKENKTSWPDPMQVAGDVYKTVIENNRVRVAEVRFKPGQKAVMHWHPDHVIHILADFTLNLTLPDGSSQRVPLKMGQTLWVAAGPHAAQNIGTTEGHAVVVELK